MQIWRICKKKHKDTAFSGEGGLYTEARWTPQGIKTLYTAESLALASLEVFIHTESAQIPLLAIRVLTAQAPTVTPHSPGLAPVSCRGS